MPNSKRVFVTGIGVICPLGVGVDEFWSGCLRGKGVIGSVPSAWETYGALSCPYWAPLPQVNFESFGLGRSEQRQLDTSQLLALATCQLAVQDAGLPVHLSSERKSAFAIQGVDPINAAVHLGCSMGGVHTLFSHVAHVAYSPLRKRFDSHEYKDVGAYFERAPSRFNPFMAPMSMPNGCTARVGIRYGLKGHHNLYSTGCAAGTTAIGHAWRAIQAGEIDFAIAGGVDYLSDPYGVAFRSFDIARTLLNRHDTNPQLANRPFDEARTGFLFAEGGCAILILEEAEAAMRRRGGRPRVYAELDGYAETFDAHNIMMPDPNGEQIERMLRKLLATTDTSVADVDYINAHGTGTRANDDVESAVIERIFGKQPMVNSTKSLIGHSIGASGALEAAATALSLFHQVAHVSANIDEPVRDLNFVRDVRENEIRVGVTQSFAFGGHNAGLLLRRSSPLMLGS